MTPDGTDDRIEGFAEPTGDDDELLARLAEVLDRLTADLTPPNLDIAAVWADIDRRLDDEG